MVLGNPKGEKNVVLDICGERVEQTQSIKILGLKLDENLNFRDHIRGMCTKVGRMIGMLRRFKNLIHSMLSYFCTNRLSCHTLPTATLCDISARHLIFVNWSGYKKEP